MKAQCGSLRKLYCNIELFVSHDIQELRTVKKIIRECSWRLEKVLEASHTHYKMLLPTHSYKTTVL